MKRPALTLAALLAAVSASAEDSAPAKPPRSSPVQLIGLSIEVAEFGRAERDPLAMIVAAQLRKGLALRPVDRKPDGEAAAPTAGDDPYSVETLLADALAFGRNAPTIRAMADEVRASASKGRSDGVAVNVSTARAGGTDWYRRQRFDAGKYAEAAVELLGGGAVDFFVYDSNGNVVCRDVRQPARGYCGWTPKPGETFDIKVENRNPAPVRYRLSTN